MARPPRGRMPGTDRTQFLAGEAELPFDMPRKERVRPHLPRIGDLEPTNVPAKAEVPRDVPKRRSEPHMPRAAEHMPEPRFEPQLSSVLAAETEQRFEPQISSVLAQETEPRFEPQLSSVLAQETEPRFEPQLSSVLAQETESRFEPQISSVLNEEPKPRFEPVSAPALTATDPELPDVEPEDLGNPFDYYAMPQSDQRSPRQAQSHHSDTGMSEFLTSKYFTPRSDFAASRELERPRDPVDSWSRNVRPGRPVIDTSSTEDETPTHMRHFPSRVRDHLRNEPKMPSATEPLRSFVSAPEASPQLRSRSGLPLPLAPEMRAPMPQDVRVKRRAPEAPIAQTFVDPRPTLIEEAPVFEQDYESARDDFETVIDRDLPPLVATRDMAEDLETMRLNALYGEELLVDRRDQFSDDEEFDDDDDGYADDDQFEPDRDKDIRPQLHGHSHVQSRGYEPQQQDSFGEPPSWMRKADTFIPPEMATSDWDQDHALHAMTARLRNRAAENEVGLTAPRREAALNKVQNLFFTWLRKRSETRAERKAAKAARSAPRMDRINTQSPVLQADDFSAHSFIGTDDPYFEDEADFVRPAEKQKFWKRKARNSIRVSADSNRAYSRKRQSRLYEDIVAWVVVPPFIIGAIYGGLELAKILSNSPLGKMLSGQ